MNPCCGCGAGDGSWRTIERFAWVAGQEERAYFCIGRRVWIAASTVPIQYLR